jgi:ectoine hydroxylase-related dioxygenase (phytanoyl-CoA dioxygenase family)
MFQFSEQHIEEFQTHGFTVFRGIVPAKLIDELRAECDCAAELVRQQKGPNTQRFQPIDAFEINQKPFEEFQSLEEVHDAVSRVLPMPWESSGLHVMGVLLEPAQDAWCTSWHRDWRDNIKGLDLAAWEAQYQNLELFNQVNCALYEDSCTWVVPGSHLRRDTEAEFARFPTRPIAGPQLDGLSAAEREVACLEYCQSMPGATRLFLDAGDYCLYRNSLWHLGNYIPYRKRATLHDGIMTKSFREWFETAPKIAAARREQGIEWENPNADRMAA